MATRAAEFVYQSTFAPSPDNFRLEVWRVAGGTAADTTTIAPRFGGYVRRITGPFGHGITTSGNSTNVVLTHPALSTSLSYDVELYIQNQ